MSCRPFLGLLPRSLSPFEAGILLPFVFAILPQASSANPCQESASNTNFFLFNTTFQGTPHTGPWKIWKDRKSFRLLDGVVRPQVSRPRDKHRGWQIFALHATRSERWLAVGPAWDRALGAPLFPETSVGADKGRVGGCIVDRGPRICAGYHHPARPTDWTHFLVSKRKKTPRGEEGVERRYAAASDLQGFVQGGSEDSDSQLQER